FHGRSSFILPMSTTRARSLASFTAASTGPLVEPPADRNTWSAPRPLVILLSSPSTASRSSGDPASTAPAFSARRQRSATGSTPIACTPAAISSRTTSCPIRPRPMTAAVSPSCTSARRTPCMAIDATVAKAACSGATPSGTAAHKLTGTQLYSACSACSFPAQATSWPTLNSSAPLPTSVTTPQRVAERRVRVELVHHLLVGRHEALLLHLVDDLLHLVGPGPGHADHRHARLA